MPVMIDESVKQLVKVRFSAMKNPVTIKVFSTKQHCLLCNEMISLIESVGELSDKIMVDICECDTENPIARKYGIERHPAIVIEGDKNYGVRFFGIPAGKEFTTLIEAIMLVSSRDPNLSKSTLEALKKVDKKVHLQVFVTLECPYCPAMVLLADRMALASDNITADMIEATQFGELAMKYDIFGVPNTIINERVRVEGLVPEQALLAKILEALKEPDISII